MAKLTAEQLAAHRNRQREYARRSMSDSEFEARYDPQGHRDRLLLQALEDLTEALQRLSPDFPSQAERPWRPARPAPVIRARSGPIEV